MITAFSKLRELKIGNLSFTSNLLLAPMAGITDKAFRLLVKSFGVDLVFTEMISSNALMYKNVRTRQMCSVSPKEKPVAVQIFGQQPEIMAEAAKYIETCGADILNINLGCPAPKVVKNGAGCALMKNPLLVGNIIERVSRSVNIAVTVKIRAGWNEAAINAVEIAQIAENCGALAVVVHWRTAHQLYRDQPNWRIIREVKHNVKIPVIANGDIVNGETAELCLQQTDCDGIMIGRASLGRPWIFDEIKCYLGNKKYIPLTIEEKLNVILGHVKSLVNNKGEERGIKEARKHLIWYAKGQFGVCQLKNSISKLARLNETEELIKTAFLLFH